MIAHTLSIHRIVSAFDLDIFASGSSVFAGKNWLGVGGSQEYASRYLVSLFSERFFIPYLTFGGVFRVALGLENKLAFLVFNNGALLQQL